MAAGDSKPTPDPTALTTEGLLREIAHLKELVQAIGNERDRRYEDRYLAQQESLTLALNGVEAASKAALAATEKAIDKSEKATQTAIDKAENMTGREFASLNAKVDALGRSMDAKIAVLERAIASITG